MIKPKVNIMNKILENNMKALIAYANTDRYQQVWEELYSVEYLVERSTLFLNIFNTLQDRLKNPSEEAINKLIKLMTKREFFIHLIKEGVCSSIDSVSTGLQFKKESNKIIEIPEFKITEKQYELFYETAKVSYKESSDYHKRRQELDENYAEHGFYEKWSLLGEVFNKIIAKDYIKNIESKKIEDMPLSYKQTISGQEIIKQKMTNNKKNRI